MITDDSLFAAMSMSLLHSIAFITLPFAFKVLEVLHLVLGANLEVLNLLS